MCLLLRQIVQQPGGGAHPFSLLFVSPAPAARDGGFYEKLAGFFIHLVPSFILVIGLAIAWKRPFAGGCVLILLSLLFTLQFNTYRLVSYFLIISVPLFVAGVLFIVFHVLAKKEST
ncbi:DUF7670 domain-containing protein [Pelotomaculum propionicicum]|uniref:DUF7670 domain-containing protein n=1 Tax=Pelotomaculum propionicicum TaxID=258475 RepID=UPI003D07FCCD